MDENLLPEKMLLGLRLTVGEDQVLLNYKDAKTKCRLYWFLKEFIDWRYSQSLWYFDPAL